MSSILADQLHPLYMSPKCEGEGRVCEVSANEKCCAHHVTWSPNKLWRSNSMFNLWGLVPFLRSDIRLEYFEHKLRRGRLLVCKRCRRSFSLISTSKQFCNWVVCIPFVQICGPDQSLRRTVQRWNSWKEFLVEVSSHKFESSQTLLGIVLSGFLSSFFCPKTIHSSLFLQIFCMDF